MSDATSDIESTVGHLAELHRQHERSTTGIQRAANRVTGSLGRPVTLAALIFAIVSWILANTLADRLGFTPLEQLPFPNLEFLVTVAALLIALLILTTQQHQNQLAERRAQLTLQIALLSEKKVAKVIELLEEQRRESPVLASRVDEEAEAMAQSADPKESLASLDRSTEQR